MGVELSVDMPLDAPALNSPHAATSRSLAEGLESALARARTVRLTRVRGGARPYLLARLRARHPGPLLIITGSSAAAEKLLEELRIFEGDAAIRLYPRHDTPPFDRFSPHPELEARRMSLLYSLLAADDTTPITVVAPWSALLRRVPPRAELRSRVTHIERGMTVDRDALIAVLIAAGYHRTSLVEERGEVAARGGILDLFPPQLDRPVRLEFDFDDLASVRHFNPVTQRSDEELHTVVAIPPRTYRLPHDLDPLLQSVRDRGRQRGTPESNIYAVTEALSRRHLPAGMENLEALFHTSQESMLDYLPPAGLIVVDDPEAVRSRGQSYGEEVIQGHARACARDQVVCEPLELYQTDEVAWDALRARRPVLLDPLGIDVGSVDEERIGVSILDHRELRSEITAQRGSGRALEPLCTRLDRWRELGRHVRFLCPSRSSAERLGDILRDYGRDLPLQEHGAGAPLAWTGFPAEGRAEICIGSLSEGFELPEENLVVLTEQDIFGSRLQRRPRPRGRRGQALDRLAQIQEGDHLVHAEHGIGTYGGLVQLELGSGIRQELLLICYDRGDKLYLPVSRLAQIQRYTGADGRPPRIDRLGGLVWAQTKRKVRRAVREMAENLLAVSAARKLMRGHAYPAPDASYEEFEAGFPYEDTPDQRRATEEILADLCSELPMERLICGDVGFGKTEIACRAAYVTCAAGKQVAFLVPTTVLCQQHLRSLEERFLNTPVNIAALSRLSSARELRDVRAALASGRVDIVIATHKLLSGDIQFRDLGLLVIDEEHRFGVAHKERIKQLRKLVNVLTLSATPIPRTLHMALSGMRDLSVIMTPPPDRIAIRTQVCTFSEEIVAEAIHRELRRGGQVFAVHNRVETIQAFADHLRAIVPDTRIEVAHGQMAGSALEEVMLRFTRHEFDVLLSTAIIESGLDIPNVNTILIHRADRFGLAQLYQLRGRVGRSDRQAYAYLFVPSHGQLTAEARRRIESIQDLSELGVGFRLAMDDLEIRGAGDVLGAEQSGQLAAVGYDLYVEMLEQAIEELRGQAQPEAVEPDIKLPLAALLPESYVPEVSQRLVLYKQLSSARSGEELAAIRDDLLDRFGALPDEARNLLEVIRLKIRCRTAGVESVQVIGSELVVRVNGHGALDPKPLLRAVHEPDARIRIRPDHHIHVRIPTPAAALAESFALLELIEPPGHAGRDADEATLPPAARWEEGTA